MKNTLVLLLAVTTVATLCAPVIAQQRKIPKEPVQVVDASTGKLIPEVLLLPRYSSFKGVSTLLGEGPGGGSYSDYLAKPFVYHPGDPFILKLPKSKGFILPGFLFMGKARTLEGVLVVAPGYRPEWFITFWSLGAERKLKLTPISDKEWSAMREKTLSHLEKDVTRIEDYCSFWDIAAPCALEIHYNKKERELVRTFLREPRSHP